MHCFSVWSLTYINIYYFQVMTLETVVDSDGQLEPWRAVKQYSRSSADQEIPMCFELRPAAALCRTCAYLLHEIADTTRQVNVFLYEVNNES